MGSKGRGGRARQQPNRASVVKQMQDLQERMLKAQQELATETVTASAGGGAVTVVMDGQQQVRQVIIAAEAADPAEVDMLQDMVMAAMNEALGKARQLSEEKMAPLAGALGMPGLL